MPLLHATILGEGTPMLILHGFLGMSDNWRTLGKQYAEQGFQVHLLDQRNHGRSFHSAIFDYDALAQDLNAYCAQHNLGPAIVLGHSMGGKTAMQFACTFPDKVSRLLIADIAPKFYPPHHQPILNALNSLDFSEIKSRSEADRRLQPLITDQGTRLFLLKNLYWKTKGQLALRPNLPVLSEKMGAIGENIASTDTYGGPTLFLRGDRSEYIALTDLPEIKRHFPQALLKTVENAGHWLHAENPKAFFSKSMDFILS